MSVNTKVSGQLVRSAGLYKTSVPIQSGDIYSFEERQVGVFADGKPLYQKTVDCGALPANTTKNVAHGITDIDRIVSVSGCAFRSASGNETGIPLPSTHYQTIGNQNEVSVNFTNVVLRNGNSGASAFDKTQVTIRYTKTTDVAGSGEYVPSGDKAVHYSTNEQVIGTWIGGSTLYEKTVEGTTITGATTFSVPHGISNFNELIDANIVCKSSDNSYWRTLNFAYNNGTTNDNWLGGFAINDTNILFQIGTNFSEHISKWYATIRYTKTS